MKWKHAIKGIRRMRRGEISLPINIEEYISRAKYVPERHNNVIFAYLFGGLAKGRISLISDVDIAVLFSVLAVNRFRKQIRTNKFEIIMKVGIL